MAIDINVYREAAKRGLLNDNQKAALVELQRRQAKAEDRTLLTPGTESGVSVTFQETPRTTMADKIALGADDFVRSVASTMLPEVADEIAARANASLGFGTYEENLAAERARDEQIHPLIKYPGKVLGAVTTGTGLVKGGVSLLKNAPKTLPSLATRGAGEGALYGGAYGFGAGEGVEGRLRGAGEGGLLGFGTGGVLGGITRGLVGGRSLPTVKEVKKIAGQAYDKADDAGVIIRASSINRLVKNVERDLTKKGYTPALHEKTAIALKELQNARTQNHTLKSLDLLRQVANDAKLTAKQGGPDAFRARMIVDRIDDFVDKLSPMDALMGPTRTAVGALKEGRSMWKTAKKAEVIEDLMDRALNRAETVAGSGYENALRIEFRGLIRNTKEMKRFTEAERDFIKRVARGDHLANLFRRVGKFHAGGQMSAVLSGGAGYALAGPWGLFGVLAAGAAGRAGATAATRANAQRVVEEILKPATRGPTRVTSDQAKLLQRYMLTGIEAERAALAQPNQTGARQAP